METCHYFLVAADSLENAWRLTRRFLDNNMLVRYQQIHLDSDACLAATSERFWPTIHELGTRHQHILEKFINELAEAGTSVLTDLLQIDQGYPSKIFHIVAHLVDGFFGVDSIFYNLPEGSHRISPDLHASIQRQPDSFYLIKVTCSFASPAAASILHRRQGS